MNAILPLSWVRVGRLDDIPPRAARVVRTPAGDVAVFRTGTDEVFALQDRCPHGAGPLSNGIVHDRRVTCPLHGMVLDLTTGHAVGPESCSAATIPARVVDGMVELGNLDTLMGTAHG